MKEEIKIRLVKRFKVLNCLYKQVEGRTSGNANLNEIKKVVNKDGVNETDFYIAYEYLQNEGLITKHENEIYSITHEGVKVIEFAFLFPDKDICLDKNNIHFPSLKFLGLEN